MNMKDDILDWYSTGELGSSSKAMANAVLGKQFFDKSHPLDPSDLNRCIKFLIKVPEARNHMDKISDMSLKWSILVKNWSLLEITFIEEVGYNWCKAKSSPRTFKLMQELLEVTNEH